MKLESAQTLCSYGTEVQLYEDYSGRGMYGKTTTGVVVESILSFYSSLADSLEDMLEYDDKEEVQKLIAAMKDIHSSDSLGFSTILY